MTDTKTRILDAALALFNRFGERNVTTNHIAGELGISPGNLYYHYRNKAAIVSALFDRYQAHLLTLLTVPAGPLTWEDKMRYFEGILESMWEGRFLHRDLAHFLHQDPALRERYKRFVEDSLARGLEIYRRLRDSGLIEASDEELRALLVNTWVLAASWSGFTHGLNPDIAGDETLDRRLLRQGIYQIICLEAPFLRGEALRHLDAMKREYRIDENALDRLFGADGLVHPE
ncbi:TetR family transcriptional regulator [Alcanivorax sp. 521-1]|uniref:TetR family transcriptional regulator n=1 Tax=Alloalcanivorax profundimaris TaxID=2735259 RepID=A0ABS0ASN5_9GAMM|nr:TetR/AcrR family transcriptional regulator [Alloalcanivorax profundimaris]MAO58355.1 TetR family transcriptional regulator [Alcanivorax sp.]MBM1142392.1 TetR/AcrR family transcriptional regulator [Alcanivorax sp. ZXX171]QJX02571.1 TetR/AcrR family transcriptional regulator [Alcanivorax sp. IO_7]MBF5056632.1 TetR family transcriptional regulator [Alloalcanivorax profundimaris]HCE41817.1 TetR family transcriptional regulator [Alcanivorax sp.]|tara:strand:+ start:409 stop:1101 length:693 start_codon:yes stop_codon:yes gene_type:complete